MLQKSFENPTIEFMPRPLWFWNAKPTVEGISEIMEKSKKLSGYGGFGILSYDACGMDYMKDEYLKAYGAALEKAEELGLKMCLYDEWWFPSGSAGGLVQKHYPEHCAKRLDLVEFAVEAGKETDIKIPEGKLMSVVAMNLQTKECIDLTQNTSEGTLKWISPSNEYKIMIFTCVLDGWDRVDYLDPLAVSKFIELSHEEYYKHFKKYFGTVIDCAFYDEPQFYAPKGRMWTYDFNQKFTKKYGYDPAVLYPALWYDIGENTNAARNLLLGFRAELYCEGFPKVIQEWCSDHGISLTGHVDQEEVVNPVGITGDLIKSFKYQEIPGIDEIFTRARAGKSYKIVSSAAANYDRALVMSETFGAMSVDMDVATLYKETMELYVKGINLLVPHAVWYDSKNIMFAPELSYRSEQYGAYLKEFNTYSARLSFMLQGGRHVADIGVLYPIAGLNSAYYMDWGNPYEGGPTLPEFDYQDIGEVLFSDIKRDFTFIHPEVLDDNCNIGNGYITLNNEINFEKYRVFVLPGSSTISLSNINKLLKLYENGGIIIATSQLPYKSAEIGNDSAVIKVVQAIFNIKDPECFKENKLNTNQNGGKAYFIPNKETELIKKALDSIDEIYDVVINYGQITGGILACMHKVKFGKDIYFIANSSDENISTWVTIRNEINVELWNPHDGLVSTAKQERLDGVTKVWIELGSAKSIFIVSTDKLS